MRKAYVVRRLCLAGRGIGCPASNNAGWVTSDEVNSAPPGSVAAGFMGIF